MRCNIEINENLLRKALKTTGFGSTRAVVEEGLRLLVKVKGQETIRHLRGKIPFDRGSRKKETGE
ncbi:MAG: hypothetical protein OJF47_004013 [Nitrospira sp.]|jgi:Arc/MetJ family transcription regulator|nr:MAG: hypothetical protein OJF47_004013 [Nitrospira sp.]